MTRTRETPQPRIEEMTALKANALLKGRSHIKVLEAGALILKKHPSAS